MGSITELEKQDSLVGNGSEAVAGGQVTVHYTGGSTMTDCRSQRPEVRQLARSERSVHVPSRRRGSDSRLG